ncbi:conjugative transfer signal peptidase TraF [Bilophila wadsworthia]|uniref:conjugative transfer signal peptidase TraF n=1 Tax=Bilophila wadsworthia TaxID=35833 RepID=UPI001D0AAE5C|nr:conjugative transfer signal peptidase TraF [Bilophila wadsworthia]MCB8572295.1 conjugative transfer signal peptidase TraF [Bilophila wadsworthia]MCC2715309.1 conjugative transfer signal peptidase TraF [Bilophila wadsworthia]
MNAILWNSRVRRWLFAALWLLLAGLLAHSSGLRINPTPSLPKGIYRLAPEHGFVDLAKGDLVSFCLRGEFADLVKERGYLQAGSCDNGLRPLLKRLAGLPGDHIDAAALTIRTADSQGRPMPSVLQSGVIPTGMALVLADHEGSFDSRYFGLVPLEALQRVEPVFVFTPNHTKE